MRSAFFPPGQQQEAIDVSQRYIGKSDPYLVLVSTPNDPGDLMDRIKQEPEHSCIYHKLYLDNNYGLGKICSDEEINRAKGRGEYDLKFTGGRGDVFHRLDIDAITSDSYDPTQLNLQAPHYMGIDPRFGSSSTGIVITRYQNQKLEVVHAEEITKGRYEEIHKRILSAAVQHWQDIHRWKVNCINQVPESKLTRVHEIRQTREKEPGGITKMDLLRYE